MKFLLAVSMVLALTSSSFADFNFSASPEGSGYPRGLLSPTVGSTYFIAPGAGTESGFQLAGGPFSDSIINNAGELIGPDISGNGLIVSTDSLTQNSATNFDLVFRLATTVGGNIMPTGVMSESGVELTTLGLFVGGGINPVDFDTPIFANTAVIEVFNLANQSIGTINVIGLSNFTTGDGGGWDGSLGLNFGSQIPIGDVGAIEFRINFDSAAVPEPATAGFVAAAFCIGLLRRKRAASSLVEA